MALASSLRYWYRQKYNLPHTDPRFLAVTDDEIRIEYEAEFAWNGEEIKACPECGIETLRKQCPRCIIDGEPLVLTEDPILSDALSKMQRGIKVDTAALEAALRGGFEPVKPGER